MAIEFHCPYCTAVIRVPDAFGGKSGSCPKCATKLLVPAIAPKIGQQANPPMADAAEHAPVAPNLKTEFPPDGHDLSTAPESCDAPGVADIPMPNADSRPSVTRSLRKKQRRRKSQRIFAVAIPVVCFLLLIGVLGVIFFATEPELTGTLIGSNAGKFDLPSATVSLTQLGLPPLEQAGAQDAFKNDPEAFMSSQMTCRIRIDGSDVITDITIGDGFSLFLVNPAVDQHLSKWINTHKIQINSERLLRLTENGANLCRDKMAKFAGSPVVFDAQLYRDDFGLNTHVRAFGYIVEAVTEQRRSRCVHEDTNGTLYFVLPETTSHFTLQGRKIDSSTLQFPGQYLVSVTTKAIPPATSADKAPPNDSENENMDSDTSTNEAAEMTVPDAKDTDSNKTMSEKME